MANVKTITLLFNLLLYLIDLRSCVYQVFFFKPRSDLGSVELSHTSGFWKHSESKFCWRLEYFYLDKIESGGWRGWKMPLAPTKLTQII